MSKGNTPRIERREFGRRSTIVHGWLVLERGVRVPCTVLNLSVAGAMVDMAEIKALPFRFTLSVPSHGIDETCEIRHQSGARLGLRFVQPAQTDTAGTAQRRALPNEVLKEWKGAEVAGLEGGKARSETADWRREMLGRKKRKTRWL